MLCSMGKGSAIGLVRSKSIHQHLHRGETKSELNSGSLRLRPARSLKEWFRVREREREKELVSDNIT